MPGIKEMFGKFFNPEQNQKEDKKETEILTPENEDIKEPQAPETVDGLNADEEERLDEGNQIRKMAEEAAREAEKSDKAERPEDKKE